LFDRRLAIPKNDKSPQPGIGISCNLGRSRNAFMAAACQCIVFS